ncbi:hypothetical protein DV707_07180 [Halobellus limi]|uniref:Uncharacterized protein n=1 Tax=Halobellus limi TaxID=699433 RepID=A0A4D6H384_9EURY|nr:hypothetical protein DV707_07180 [Halobellus limi]
MRLRLFLKDMLKSLLCSLWLMKLILRVFQKLKITTSRSLDYQKIPSMFQSKRLRISVSERYWSQLRSLAPPRVILFTMEPR